MSASLLCVAFGDLEPELASSRRVLERVPEAHLEWRPHPKSWTLGHLDAHVAQLPMWISTALQQDELDLATLPPRAIPSSTQAILDTFDQHAAGIYLRLLDVPVPDTYGPSADEQT